MSNTKLKGTGHASGDQFTAFDKLPPTARQALRDADFNWAATTILARHRRAALGYRNGIEIASAVKKWDRKQHRADVKRGLVAP